MIGKPHAEAVKMLKQMCPFKEKYVFSDTVEKDNVDGIYLKDKVYKNPLILLISKVLNKLIFQMLCADDKGRNAKTLLNANYKIEIRRHRSSGLKKWNKEKYGLQTPVRKRLYLTL